MSNVITNYSYRYLPQWQQSPVDCAVAGVFMAQMVGNKSLEKAKGPVSFMYRHWFWDNTNNTIVTGSLLDLHVKKALVQISLGTLQYNHRNMEVQVEF
ncbi:hypothetical protein BOTCAL_0038g00030 [Botryotinia calthae]|uniref:Uncharacterized protein n=1 Tax=Botryotinia calthae TaxID=38488 RepID=A0A4Y8DCB3_9HELO|nr:hypothetical protein BOTCAL_0038g00030 [Botryotinia calthae]